MALLPTEMVLPGEMAPVRGDGSAQRDGCPEAQLTEAQKTSLRSLREAEREERGSGANGTDRTNRAAARQARREAFQQRALSTVPGLTEAQKTALKAMLESTG